MTLTGYNIRKRNPSSEFSFLKCANQLKWFIHPSFMVLQTEVTWFLKVQRRRCISLPNPCFQNDTCPRGETATPAQNKVTCLLLICSVKTGACLVLPYSRCFPIICLFIYCLWQFILRDLERWIGDGFMEKKWHPKLKTAGAFQWMTFSPGHRICCLRDLDQDTFKCKCSFLYYRLLHSQHSTGECCFFFAYFAFPL